MDETTTTTADDGTELAPNAADAGATEGGHCKSPTHVRANTSTAPGGHGPGYMGARYEAELVCPNKVPPGTSWGVVLTHTTATGTVDGMKLLPTAAAVLPHELRLAAQSASPSVVIEHTIRKVWEPYVQLTPDAANELATAIETAAEQGATELEPDDDADDATGTTEPAGTSSSSDPGNGTSSSSPAGDAGDGTPQGTAEPGL